MESTTTTTTTTFKKPAKPCKNVTRTPPKTIAILVLFTISTLLLVSLLRDSSSTPGPHSSTTKQPVLNHDSSSPQALLHHQNIIKNGCCINSLYPSLCFTTLSSIPSPPATAPSNTTTTLHHLLEFSINQTMKKVVGARSDIMDLFRTTRQDLNSQEKNALNDCMEMLDQTLYELEQAIDDLQKTTTFPAASSSLKRRHDHNYYHSYSNLKTLLSAAMTNDNTCIDGFHDLEEDDEDNSHSKKGGGLNLKEHLQNLLTPISRTISNFLAMIKYMETENNNSTKGIHKSQQRIPINKMTGDGGFQSPTWMTTSDSKMMQTTPRSRVLRPHVIVASDGTGQYHTIKEAVRMAVNKSISRYVIKIKAGLYKENVEIPREKTNIMLLGDGINTTIITASKNFAAGFSTFTSATLTVVGDRFLARDLTIMNTAGPEKHQAVAVRVTSNAAFYRCQFISYQDTLYAHSLRQFYRECTIQGTIDFIFGNAAAIFQNCIIQVRKPNPGQKNMITAQGREDPNQNTGISLHNCTIVAAPDFPVAERANFSTFLGRPWRNYSRTIVTKSYLGDLIHPEGWCKWNEYSTIDTVEYIEHMNFGPGSDTRQRITWAGYKKNCTEDIAKQFTVEAFLRGADAWLESTGVPLFSGS